MSTTTTNLGLIKPEKTDAADITATNENWDKLDAHSHRSFEHDVSMVGNRITNVAEPTDGSDVATRNFVEQHAIEGNTYIATDYNKDGNVTLKPYVADEDELIFKSHIANKNNPHEVTLAQLGAIGFKRTLTSADDLNDLTEEGIYRFSTSSIPANCPYSNAGVVEVIKADSNVLGIIQRVTRYGLVGYTVQRILDNTGNWTEWVQVPLMFKKTYTSTTNANGNAYTSIDDAYIILNISAKSADGSETYICTPYKSKEYDGSWYVNVTGVADKSNIAKTSFIFTIHYTIA